jgi:hypothetical protein
VAVTAFLEAYHAQEARIAAETYVKGLTSRQAATDWALANIDARRAIILALRETKYLTDISSALQRSGSHVRILRHILSPPISQDQFKLLCSAYSKSAENAGSPIRGVAAERIAEAFQLARDRRLTRWLDRGTPPRRIEIQILLYAVSPLLSQQIVATIRRGRLSGLQEGAVISLLQSKGWSRQTGTLITTLSDMKPRHFMHKIRFATRTQAQEVDIACGLGGTVVLAMECKVTNDETNSVKRINDVLKKAKAWQDHWGSFVRTAAMLQGVVAFKDVRRLLADNVEVFWSHKIEDFGAWIDANGKIDP